MINLFRWIKIQMQEEDCIQIRRTLTTLHEKQKTHCSDKFAWNYWEKGSKAHATQRGKSCQQKSRLSTKLIRQQEIMCRSLQSFFSTILLWEIMNHAGKLSNLNRATFPIYSATIKIPLEKATKHTIICIWARLEET